MAATARRCTRSLVKNWRGGGDVGVARWACFDHSSDCRKRGAMVRPQRRPRPNPLARCWLHFAPSQLGGARPRVVAGRARHHDQRFVGPRYESLAQARVERWFRRRHHQGPAGGGGGRGERRDVAMDSEVLYFRNSSERGYAWQILEKKLRSSCSATILGLVSVARPQLPARCVYPRIDALLSGNRGLGVFTTMTPGRRCPFRMRSEISAQPTSLQNAG